MTKLKVGKRRGALLAAVGLSIAGSMLLFGYVRGVESRALDGTEPLQVLVAKDVITAGTTAADAANRGLFEKRALPKVAVMDGAVSSLEALDGKAAIVDILKDEQIVASRFAAPDEARGLLPIPEGRQAMSVELALPPAVAGYVEPGDRVSIIANVDRPEPRAQFIIQDVPVLTVGRKDARNAEEKKGLGAGETRAIYTLAVTPPDAEKLAYAVLQGDVYFTLLPPGQAPAGTPGRTAANLYSSP